MIDKDIIQENKRIRKRNSCTRTEFSNVQSREDIGAAHDCVRRENVPGTFLFRNLHDAEMQKQIEKRKNYVSQNRKK